MLRLYLVRHAVAEEPAEGSRFADPIRALTPKGRRRFRRSAKAFADVGDSVGAIYTSPLLRSVQTAELLAAALHVDEVTVLDELRPDAAVAPLLARLAELGATSAALVGHKRLLCDLAAGIAGVDREQVHLKRGTIARFDVRKLQPEASGKPRWWLEPLGSLRNGLPFAAIG
jgi:phosphohistidine phosphatase